MLYTQIRNYLEIATILKNNYVEISQLVIEFRLSQYEYKNDLATIMDMQDAYGIVFQCLEKENLIYYQVVDEAVFRKIYPIFNELYARYFNNKIQSRKLITYCIVTWMLLNTQQPILTTTISDELGYTRSGIRDALKWAKNYLEDYHLSYTNVPHYGIAIKGGEFYKRLALIGLNNFIDPRIIIDLDPSLIYNEETPDIAARLQPLLHELTNRPNIAISYLNLKLLQYYLVIQANRIKRGFLITERTAYEDIIAQTQEYLIASELWHKLYAVTTPCLPEIYYLAMLIMTVNEAEQSNLYRYFTTECQNICNSICRLLYEHYGLTLSDPHYLEALQKAVSRIYIKHTFHMATLQGFSLSGKSFAAVNKPLLLLIRNDILQLLSQSFQIRSQKSNMIELIDIIQRYIQTLPILFPKKHLCLVSHTSIVDTLLLKDRIQEKYAHLFEPEIEILTNPLEMDVSSHQTIYVGNYLPNHASRRNVYILDDHLNDIKELPAFLIAHSHLSTIHIQSIQARQYDHFEDVTLDLKPYQSVIRQEMAFFIRTHHQGKATLQLFQFHNKTTNSHQPKATKWIVLDFQPTNQNIQLFDLLLTMFVTDETLFTKLISKPDLQTLDIFFEKSALELLPPY